MVALPVVACIDCVSDVGEDALAALAHGFVGCLHVGHSLMGSMGSASMMVTITVFCGAADGIDDDISVRLHGRSLVLYGWFKHPYSYKAKDPNILCHARPLGELINAL
ncbi:hypothetical protein CIP107510_02105 [Corynebacterium diphtheriae]|uniref:hypothetical protein n=1 Tax=Corynebacterium diphtheriae TaxID=1717 RepID=UPI00092D98B2|nr:hypothetical protein [Corynebacterium diphtheriae]APM36190.1 hypothetical protein BS112_06605 [Corynebacterium diphtheriae]MBG9277752.1 hypothetical protein [Corynebacterium diphtheriae bv. mitis]MBG9282249.1 hypothetical protein [Corynebacterium diphtheriae bv. mitis]MBG9304114.1 hypothetical protein [Corynebacterium diphtheriae bv. mitis]CAB0570479.1 hypothetical protein CIP107510_02105 [Corynebacterium diphtheriae]